MRTAAQRALHYYRDWQLRGDNRSLNAAVELIGQYRSSHPDGHSADAPWLIKFDGWAGYPIAPPVDFAVSTASGPASFRTSRTLRPDLAHVFGLPTPPRSGFRITVIRTTQELDTPLFVHAIAESGEALRLDLPQGQIRLQASPTVSDASELAGHVDHVFVAANRQSPAWSSQLAAAIAESPTDAFELLLTAGMKNEAEAWFRLASPLLTSRFYDARAVKLVVALGGVPEVADALTRASNARFAVTSIMRPTTDDVIRTVNSIGMSSGRPLSASVGYLEPESFPVATLRDASITSDGIVVTSGALAVLEAAAEPCAPFVAGQWDRVYASPFERCRALVGLPTNVQSIDEAVLVSTRCSANYFHSLIEHAPRLMTIDAYPELHSLPLIVDRGVPGSVVEAIRLLNPAAEVIFTDRDHTMQVGTLHVPLLHTYIPDSLEIPFDRIRLSKPHLRFLANGLRSHAAAATFPSRFYIRREENTRNLSNAAEVEALLSLHGFVALDPSTLDFREQLALFANATDIIGVAGAAFSNTIFCSKEARVTAFYAYQNRDYPLQRLMCEAVGLEFSAFAGIRAPGTPDRWRTQTDLHSQFELNPAELEAHLARFHSRTVS